MRLSRQALSRQVASLVIALLATLSALALPANAKVGGINGQIVFARFEKALNDSVIYAVNPNGSGLERLSPGNLGGAEGPRWSPDGSRVAFSSAPPVAAVITDVDTRTFRLLPMQEPATLLTFCSAWSPDGARLACDSFSLTDPSLNGIYSIRSSDGGDLTQVTSNPGGLDTSLCDYSPDGRNFAMVPTHADGSSELDTVNLSTGVVKQLAPADTTLRDFQCGSWSPDGDQILFAARPAQGHRRALYVVNSDGTGLRQVPISPSCGGAASDSTSRGCQNPGWSPDGTKIVFHIFAPGIHLNNTIFTANADGSGLFQVTHAGAIDSTAETKSPSCALRACVREGDTVPDWGTHPLTG